MNENSKQTLIFGENLSATVLPGMVQSVKDLILLAKYQPVENFELGRFTSIDYEIIGYPTNMQEVGKLVREQKRRHDFANWAVTRIGLQPTPATAVLTARGTLLFGIHVSTKR